MANYDEINKLIAYDKETGIFTWKVHRPGTFAGSVAGTKHNLGYIRISVNCKLYLAHRLAYLLMTGRWPNEQIDHINGIRDDNRWINLREATQSQNQHNREMCKNNTSGYKGVYWNKKSKKWLVNIWLNRKRVHVGYFDSREDAAKARMDSAKKLHKNFHRSTKLHETKI
jgi:hypothetical protein